MSFTVILLSVSLTILILMCIIGVMKMRCDYYDRKRPGGSS